jgi:hypothetical protein
MIVNVTDYVSNQGTVLVFEATTEDGRTIKFGADHRPGRDLVEALANHESVVAWVEDWQVIG